jgi:hypothetical protein
MSSRSHTSRFLVNAFILSLRRSSASYEISLSLNSDGANPEVATLDDACVVDSFVLLCCIASRLVLPDFELLTDVNGYFFASTVCELLRLGFGSVVFDLFKSF